MLAYIGAPFYFGACALILIYLIKWITACCGSRNSKPLNIIVSVIFILLAATPILAFFWPVSPVRRLLSITGYFWFAVFIYALMITVLFGIITFIVKKAKKVPKHTPVFSRRVKILAGTLALALILGVSLYGSFHAKDIKTREFSTQIPKTCQTADKLNVVLISDIHLSASIGPESVKDMVSVINSMDPDIVCVAGDIFSNDFDEISDPAAVAANFRDIKSTYGVYACYGNHDVDEPILAGFTFSGSKKHPLSDPRMDKLVKDSGMILLRDEVTTAGKDIYIIGRRDFEKSGTKDGSRKSISQLTSGLDKKKPVILLDHEPSDLEEEAKAGIDLVLAGHTHNGQFFPLTLARNIIWDHVDGVKKNDDMTAAVTSGSGYFGPAVRVGSNSEVVKITVSFVK